MQHKFPYNWTLKDAVFTKDKGNVFSCFACGGGSTMGYKLAGFNVLGCNEIDNRMIECYRANHHPRYSFHEPIQTFKARKDLPPELYNLDILDGSPPCSSFSLAGNREKDWGKEKKFREGQQKQILDTLFFDYIDLAKELQPKVVVAENVKGLLLGDAKQYYKKIHKEFAAAGYAVTAFLLNGSHMGVPQRRERVFVIGVRLDIATQLGWANPYFPELTMQFNEPGILFGDIRSAEGSQKGVTPYIKERMAVKIKSDDSIGDINLRVHGKNAAFTLMILHDDKVAPTITAGGKFFRYHDDTTLSKEDLLNISTFPADYDFLDCTPQYLMGMSVPPVMIAQIATQLHNQIFAKL